MEALETLLTRRSIRAYEDRMPAQELIDKVMEAGLYAASGKGQQSPIIISVTNKELRDKLSRMNCEIGGWKEGFDPFFNAPVVQIVLAPIFLILSIIYLKIQKSQCNFTMAFPNRFFVNNSILILLWRISNFHERYKKW